MLLLGTVMMIVLLVHNKNKNNDVILRETSAVYAFDNGISVIENENKTKDSVEIDENGREIIEFELPNVPQAGDDKEFDDKAVEIPEEEKRALEINQKNYELYEQAVELGQNVRVVECADFDRITFSFAGDILLDDSYAMMDRYKKRGSVLEDTFSTILLEKMRNADVFMLNNEFTFTGRGTPTEGKKFTFRAKPENVQMLLDLGVDVVSVANNHIYDYGEISLLDTLDTLESVNISYAGAGRNLEHAMKPVYIIANGMKIAIVSATQIERNSNPDTKAATETKPGVLRCMEPELLVQVIQEAKANSDYTILYIHWGTESQTDIDWLQEKQAPIYAQAGADLIIGDHPHCLQKMDVVEGVPVIYSLGNYWFNSKTQNTCLIEMAIKDKAMEYFRFVPCKQSDCRTLYLEGQDKQDVLNFMRNISKNVTIDEEGYVIFNR